jgi:hypothetical protein
MCRRMSSLGAEDFPQGLRSDQGVTTMGHIGVCDAPVAQLDRVPGYEPGGREFESLQARHLFDSQRVFATMMSHYKYAGV